MRRLAWYFLVMQAIGVATLRLDGFISLTADDRPAVLETKPFRLTGNRLEINVDAHRGQLRVEVLDSNAAPIQGFAGKEAKTIDDLRFAPSWDRPLFSLRGKVIRLRFHLRNASIYSFRIVSRDTAETSE